MRRGQGVNEDNEGEKRARARLSVKRINAHEAGRIFVLRLMHSRVRDVGRTREGGRGKGGLTLSVQRSFMPLTERTVSNGIMLMYQRRDEMAGAHCRHSHTGNETG